jgi:hypothetical protein
MPECRLVTLSGHDSPHRNGNLLTKCLDSVTNNKTIKQSWARGEPQRQGRLAPAARQPDAEQFTGRAGNSESLGLSGLPNSRIWLVIKG